VWKRRGQKGSDQEDWDLTTLMEAPPMAGTRGLTIEMILKEAVRRQASDILISAGSPVTYHVYGRLEPHDPEVRLSPADTERLAYSILDDDQKERFHRDLDGDMSFELFDVARFRANVYQQRGSISVVLRHVPLEVPHYSSLGMTEGLIQRMLNIPNGLILVTGPTGGGKSSTLAAFLDYMNTMPGHAKHIVTIEDPIEFRMRSRHCVIDQREVGVDVHDYKSGLRAALRQMAHVIFVGEMRDKETIEIALTAAETGNIVISTLATQSSAKTINRIIDVFPVQDQDEIRTRLALTLKCVISQVLLPKKSGTGRVAAREVLFVTNPVANQIREGKIHMINNVISSGSNDGMCLLDDSLIDLYRQGLVDAATIMPRFQDQEKARMVMKR
jgi:twitching motility protein PilT